MLIDLFELASNQALLHDPASRERLRKLQGKCMALTIKPFAQTLYVTPFKEGLEYSSSLDAEADVRLTATLGAMMKISRDGMDKAELKSGELEIIGDPIVGQRFAQVIAQLDIDWEGLLAEQIGASSARAAANVATELKALGTESRTRFKHLVKRLLTEDFELLADNTEVEPFLDAVDDLRADVDRLAMRLKRIQNRSQ